MFYKYENEQWLVGSEIFLLGGRIHLTKDKPNNNEGWQWHDEAPREYLEWLEKQQEL